MAIMSACGQPRLRPSFACCLGKTHFTSLFAHVHINNVDGGPIHCTWTFTCTIKGNSHRCSGEQHSGENYQDWMVDWRLKGRYNKQCGGMCSARQKGRRQQIYAVTRMPRLRAKTSAATLERAQRVTINGHFADAFTLVYDAAPQRHHAAGGWKRRADHWTTVSTSHCSQERNARLSRNNRNGSRVCLHHIRSVSPIIWRRRTRCYSSP